MSIESLKSPNLLFLFGGGCDLSCGFCLYIVKVLALVRMQVLGEVDSQFGAFQFWKLNVSVSRL